MKLLIISNYYNPEIGAAPSRISMLAEGLSELGNEVNIVCPLPNYPFGKIFDGYKNKFFFKFSKTKAGQKLLLFFYSFSF